MEPMKTGSFIRNERDLKEQQKQSSSYRNSSNKHCHGSVRNTFPYAGRHAYKEADAIVVMYFDKKYEDYSIYNAEL